jgi:hypothetical protein
MEVKYFYLKFRVEISRIGFFIRSKESKCFIFDVQCIWNSVKILKNKKVTAILVFVSASRLADFMTSQLGDRRSQRCEIFDFSFLIYIRQYTKFHKILRRSLPGGGWLGVEWPYSSHASVSQQTGLPDRTLTKQGPTLEYPYTFHEGKLLIFLILGINF